MRPPPCPMCPGAGTYMGTAGRTRWFMCRHCGWEFYLERTKCTPRAKPNRLFPTYTPKQEK